MADDLYDQDFYLWTRAQARALRTRAGGTNALDYDRLAEEVEDLGSARRNKAVSLTLRIIQHLYKLETTRSDRPLGHWRAEIGTWRLDLDYVLTRPIRREIEADLDRLHRRAARIAQDELSDHEPDVRVDADRRWSFDEIVGTDDLHPARD